MAPSRDVITLVSYITASGVSRNRLRTLKTFINEWHNNWLFKAVKPGIYR